MQVKDICVMKEDVNLIGDFSFNFVVDALFGGLVCVCVLDKCIEV